LRGGRRRAVRPRGLLLLLGGPDDDLVDGDPTGSGDDVRHGVRHATRSRTDLDRSSATPRVAACAFNQSSVLIFGWAGGLLLDQERAGVCVVTGETSASTNLSRAARRSPRSGSATEAATCIGQILTSTTASAVAANGPKGATPDGCP